jgi:hypothetical protein
MPRKGGKLTAGERSIAQSYAVTGDKAFAAVKAGLSVRAGTVDKALQRPAVQAEIARIQQEKLFNDVLPLAVAVHEAILRDPKAPAGARVQAVKLAYDRTLGRDEAFKGKDPHEMTPDELAKAIDELKRAAADKARPVLELEVVDDEPGEDVFG